MNVSGHRRIAVIVSVKPCKWRACRNFVHGSSRWLREDAIIVSSNSIGPFLSHSQPRPRVFSGRVLQKQIWSLTDLVAFPWL